MPLTPQETQLRVTQYIQGASPVVESSGEIWEFGHLPHWKSRKRARLATDDNGELDHYLMRDTEDELPAGQLSYWQEHSDDIRSNNVAKMALEVFSIPAMSADPERLFSRYVFHSLRIYSNHTRLLLANISFLWSTKTSDYISTKPVLWRGNWSFRVFEIMGTSWSFFLNSRWWQHGFIGKYFKSARTTCKYIGW